MIRKQKKLCIIGSAPSKADAPYSDPSFDVWAVSGAIYSESLGGLPCAPTDDNSWNSVHRVDAFFEMHKRPIFALKLEKLSACKKPIVMQRHEEDIPYSEEYPIDEISLNLGDEFSSSIAYMLAYAIYLGYEEIRLYGVILLHKTEYARQRGGAKYYFGIARERGIKIWAPEDTQLTSSAFRYGYDDHDAICAQIARKKETIEEDIRNQTKVVEAAQATLWQLKGASITCDNLMAEIKGGLV